MATHGYVGSVEDIRRIRRQEKEREDKKKKFEEQKQQHEANINAAGLRQFGTGTAEVLEQAFKTETVGLVTKAEFMHKRNTLKERLEEEQRRSAKAASQAAQQEKEERQRKKTRLAAASAKLSFLGGGDDEDDEEAATDGADTAAADGAGAQPSTRNGSNGAAAAVPNQQNKRYAKLGKDPKVETDFLPDKDREVEEAELRQKLAKEWELRQQIIKNEPLEITFSFWDGSGHRRKVVVRKGDTVGDFLKACRDVLAPDFRELRNISVSNLMYVKEDLIIPNQYTFYDLIINKARGKSGPLFHFDVHEDIRTQHDARIEKDESHAGKVVERHWYSKNKHIFPASRWETFDPEKSYERYTTHGSEVN